MKNFLIGLVIGLIIATSVSSFAVQKSLRDIKLKPIKINSGNYTEVEPVPDAFKLTIINKLKVVELSIDEIKNFQDVRDCLHDIVDILQLEK